MKASELIRTTRQNIGLTQSQLSKRSGIAVPNISAIEAGKREPRFDTVQALLGGLGVRLLPVEQGRSTVFEVSAYIHEYLRAGDTDSTFRQWLQLANDLEALDGAGRILLSYQAPAPTGSRQWDAAIAALVEYRLNSQLLPLPGWLELPGFQLETPETLNVSDTYTFPVDQTEVAPEFLRRGVLFPAESLVSF